MNNPIIITGPTASGKSAIALSLAKKINCEIVSADSMQIYKTMNIGTAKPSKHEMSIVKHHMIDLCDIGQDYSVAQYKDEALACITDIIKRKKSFPEKESFITSFAAYCAAAVLCGGVLTVGVLVEAYIVPVLIRIITPVFN